jgi:L-aspartate oxidase
MLNVKTVPAIVIGSGISGLFTALKLSEKGVSVLLITKSALDDTNSRYAQGGIAAVLPESMDDSIELHVQDTLKAGAGLCDESATRSILSEGYPAILDLLAHGVQFDLSKDNQLALTQEAAHSRRRILHAGGDATGHSVEMTLIEKVKADANIDVLEHCQVIELLMAGNRCYGCRAVALQEQHQWLFLSSYTILATGGIGQIYQHTTNPAIATGDGIALAHQAGASVGDMEFVQFHPTAFYSEGKVQFLISEALRGEGGILKNEHGERFAHRYHPDGELAPRDILTRAIFSELQVSSLPYVYLDISHLPLETIETRFPTILANCARFGVDIRKDPIPVTPAAHYMMGGVVVNLQGKSSLDSLYAVGESACTGLHGANRLASNSLLECVVLARRVAEEVSALLSLDERFVPPEPVDLNASNFHFEEIPLIQERLTQLHHLMWDTVGITRTDEGLTHALKLVETWQQEGRDNSWQTYVPQGAEFMSQLSVSRLIVESALKRTESVGAHHRLDAALAKLPLLQAFC